MKATFSAVLMLFLAAHCHAIGSVNKNCSSRLTKLDQHMSTYIGKVPPKFTTLSHLLDSCQASVSSSGDNRALALSLQNYTLRGKHTDKDYMYDVGICVDPDPTMKPGCGVIQTDFDEKGKNSTTYCIGNLTKAQVARSADGVWIELTYSGGSRYHSHCGSVSRTARIVFLCDPNIGGTGHLSFLEENNQDDLCYYLFSIASRAICGYTLSVGDVLLIIFACLVALWMLAMVGGCLYKRFMMGAKGWEQVPMLSAYKEFGNLEADGCDLICRTRPIGKVIEYKEPSFGADTDEEEEDKDDNLLPM